MKIKFLLLIILTLLLFSCNSKSNNTTNIENKPDSSQKIFTGAEQTELYIDFLKNKNVAIVTNQSGLIGKTHIIDSLLKRGVKIKKIFAPEHGIRGNNERGKAVGDFIDKTTGIPVVSLFGSKKAPAKQDLDSIDIVVYDIQDVGVRFFTYISTMYLVMKSCAVNNVPMLILDRPDPNGDYVDGPVLDTANYKSFVGMLPIPVVYGLTPGELALMINSEGWLGQNLKCNLKVIKCKNYTHQTHYSLPVKPSPNLPNDISIRLYPSLCFFEATDFSVGRGTDFPFQVIGYPDSIYGKFTFIPHDIPGIQTNPLHKDQICYGIDLRNEDLSTKFTLKYLLHFYNLTPDKSKFISNKHWFDLLAGTDKLRKMILAGKTESEIRNSWQAELQKYMKIRKKYLLYK